MLNFFKKYWHGILVFDIVIYIRIIGNKIIIKKGENKIITHYNFSKLADNELVKLSQEGNKDAKKQLFLKYQGFLIKEASKLEKNCKINFEDGFGCLTYLFLCAIEKFNFNGSFKGFMKYFIQLKIKNDIGKRKAKMPYVPKDFPFYLRNSDLLPLLEDDNDYYYKDVLTQRSEPIMSLAEDIRREGNLEGEKEVTIKLLSKIFGKKLTEELKEKIRKTDEKTIDYIGDNLLKISIEKLKEILS